MRGHLFILSGPSGAGKGTVRGIAAAQTRGVEYSVSCTTRKPREGEKDGVQYHFMKTEDFCNSINAGQFLEWAEVHGNYYGTRRDIVENALENGTDILLEIDVQGALEVKEKVPEAITVFLMPPSLEELEKRLRKRGTENEENLKLRLKNAELELSCAKKYDHIIINDDATKAANEFVNLINSYRRVQK